MGARGVTVGISRADSGDAAITFMKGETEWDQDAAGDEAAIEITGGVWEERARVDDSTPTERIVAYTNIANAAPTAFHTVKGPAPYRVADEMVAPDQTTQDRLPNAGTVFTFMDDADSEDVDERTFDGSLGGATGTFTCEVGPCTLARGEADGGPTWTLSDGWTFEADAGQNINVPDADYLAFGYWNKISTTRTLADFVPFYYGSMPYSGNVQALSGRATYMGKRCGRV